MGFWEILLQHIHLQKLKHKLISVFLLSKDAFRTVWKSFSIFVPEIRTLYGCPGNKWCTDCPWNFCPKFFQDCTENLAIQMPWKTSQYLEKCTHNLWQYDPLNSLHVRTDCMDFRFPENRARLLPRFLCQLMLFDNLEIRANTLRKHNCCPPRFLCTFNVVGTPQIRTIRPVLPCCLLPLNPCLLLNSSSLIIIPTRLLQRELIGPKSDS